jgi:Zn-finger nucleic acid-binding protein
MLCPRCGYDLALQDLFSAGRHATVAGCTNCGGHWMRRSDLARLSEIQEPVILEWRDLRPEPAQQQELNCPECDGSPAMKKSRSERDTKVVLDSCEECGGVWLDGNELKAIQRESLFGILAGLMKAP